MRSWLRGIVVGVKGWWGVGDFFIIQTSCFKSLSLVAYLFTVSFPFVSAPQNSC